MIEEIRAFDPDLEIVVVDDGSPTARPAVAEERGAHVVRLPFNLGIGGAVQTGFRYAFERRLPTSPCGSTATASTTLPSSTTCSRPCSPTRPTSPSARASPSAAGYRSLAAAPSRDLDPRQDGLDARRPKGDRPDLRLPGAEPPARSRSSPPTTRTTIPEVEAALLVHKHELRMIEVPVAMRERAAGQSSIGALASPSTTWSRSCSPCSSGSSARTSRHWRTRNDPARRLHRRRDRVDRPAHRRLELIRSRRLRERYALLWLAHRPRAARPLASGAAA